MTAVEYIKEKLLGDEYWYEDMTFDQIIDKAKEIEKEQIIQSWDNGYANGYDLGKYDDQPNPDDAEQYYNETFKSE